MFEHVIKFNEKFPDSEVAVMIKSPLTNMVWSEGLGYFMQDDQVFSHVQSGFAKAVEVGTEKLKKGVLQRLGQERKLRSNREGHWRKSGSHFSRWMQNPAVKDRVKEAAKAEKLQSGRDKNPSGAELATMGSKMWRDTNGDSEDEGGNGDLDMEEDEEIEGAQPITATTPIIAGPTANAHMVLAPVVAQPRGVIGMQRPIVAAAPTHPMPVMGQQMAVMALMHAYQKQNHIPRV